MRPLILALVLVLSATGTHLALAQVTGTAAPEDSIPKIGINKVDRVIGVIAFSLIALSSFVSAAKQLKTRVDVLTGQVAQLFGSTKAVVTGVEISRRDIAEVLAAECPSLPGYRIDQIAIAIHDRLTARIQQVSTAAKVEPVLAPIVKETKSQLKAVNADGDPVPAPEGPR